MCGYYKMANNQSLYKVALNPSKGRILLIDTSYYVFYRYYATYNWYRRQKDDVNVATIMQDTTFVDKYTKMFEKTLSELCKKYDVIDRGNVIFVRDCARDNIWRHHIYDAYKATRDERSTTFNKDIFGYTYNSLIPQLENKCGVKTYGHYCLEADDVIAIITRKLFDVCQEADIIIITNDNDYIQLYTHPKLNNENNSCKLCIRNLQDKNICERVGCSPHVYCITKKVMGDKSDNIPSILKKCGSKTALKLATCSESLSKLLESSPAIKAQYDLNETLVDFMCIPSEYQNDVHESLEFK